MTCPRGAFGLPSGDLRSLHCELLLRVLSVPYERVVCAYPYSTATGRRRPLPLMTFGGYRTATYNGAVHDLSERFVSESVRGAYDRLVSSALTALLAHAVALIDYIRFAEESGGAHSHLLRSEYCADVFAPVRFALQWRRRQFVADALAQSEFVGIGDAYQRLTAVVTHISAAACDRGDGACVAVLLRRRCGRVLAMLISRRYFTMRRACRRHSMPTERPTPRRRRSQSSCRRAYPHSSQPQMNSCDDAFTDTLALNGARGDDTASAAAADASR